MRRPSESFMTNVSRKGIALSFVRFVYIVNGSSQIIISFFLQFSIAQSLLSIIASYSTPNHFAVSLPDPGGSSLFSLAYYQKLPV